MLFFSYFLLSMFISILIFYLNLMMNINSFYNKMSKSSVECGFDSISKKSFKFSNQFFMISIIFVIYDMELIIMMPFPISFINIEIFSLFFVIISFLLFSLLMEWISGLVEWSK